MWDGAFWNIIEDGDSKFEGVYSYSCKSVYVINKSTANTDIFKGLYNKDGVYSSVVA